MNSEIKIYSYPNGEIQRVQVVRFEDWSKLDFLYMRPDAGALDCFSDIYKNYLVPACPWIFGNMILFHITEDMEVDLWINRSGSWEKEVSAGVRPDSRTAHFRVENWNETTEVPFKVTVRLSQVDQGEQEYSFEGAIAPEPIDKETIAALAMSCNGDFGFPDHEVVRHGLKHQPDLVFFLGDQIYEGNGGYGVQNNPPYRKADLDFLRKWYLFGLSYRDLFRNRPSICLPDDHDVYHGNVWGEGQGSSRQGARGPWNGKCGNV